jgi:hypothetical protein
MLTPASDVKWSDAPGMPGVKMAALDGDPGKGAAHFMFKFRRDSPRRCITTRRIITSPSSPERWCSRSTEGKQASGRLVLHLQGQEAAHDPVRRRRRVRARHRFPRQVGRGRRRREAREKKK